MYHPNPKRGCGSKSYDSFYAEGGEISAGGTLCLWTWVLGDGLASGDVIPLKIPARKMTFFNPAATLSLGELILANGPYHPANGSDALAFAKMKQKTLAIGIADHVGSRFYSVWSFFAEICKYGPSRKMPASTAKVLGSIMHKVGPVPILFTHSRVPVFDSDEQRDEILGLINCLNYEPIDWQAKNFEATWKHLNFGIYATEATYKGYDHYMVPVLEAVHQIDKNWKAHSGNKGWVALRDKFESIRFIEQPIGFSWLTRVSYTLPEQGMSINGTEVPGLNIINLDDVMVSNNDG